MNSKSYKLQTGLFDRQRMLVVTPDYIEFEDKDLKGNEFTRFCRSEITDAKYGTKEIRWNIFIVGRRYSIALKNKDGRILEINFGNYFVRTKEYWDIYSELVKAIQEHYLKDIINSYLIRFQKNETLELGRIRISKRRIEVIGTSLYFEWTNLRVKEYQQYFVLSRIDAPEFHLMIDYNEWFTEVLYGLIMTCYGGGVANRSLQSI